MKVAAIRARVKKKKNTLKNVCAIMIVNLVR